MSMVTYILLVYYIHVVLVYKLSCLSCCLEGEKDTAKAGHVQNHYSRMQIMTLKTRTQEKF